MIFSARIFGSSVDRGIRTHAPAPRARTQRGRSRRHDLRGTYTHRRAQRPRHADLLARRSVWVHLLVVHAGNGRRVCRRSSDRRPRASGESVLPEHRRHAGWRAGLVHVERYRQGERVRWAAAVCLIDNDRHGADHQSRELREHVARRIRVRHRRGPQPGGRLSHRRFFEGCDHSGWQAAAWRLAFW